MRVNTNQNPHRAASRRFFPLLAAVTAVLGGAASAQQVVDGEPYGQPSECLPGGPAALGLYLSQANGGLPTLRLEGGTPGDLAVLVFASEAGATTMPGGGTLLVGNNLGTANGVFDAHGVFAHSLTDARLQAAGDQLFVQGVQPMSRLTGTELSGGLRLTRKEAECGTPELAPQPPEEILVEEFGDLLRAGHLEAALDLALNSEDDELALDLSGNLQVPVAPGVTVGGEAAFTATITRGEDCLGAVVYDLAIGADVAAAAGVGVGVAGVGGSIGVGTEVIWRYTSTHQVARAVRSMVILQAVGPRLELACLALDTHLGQINRAINAARRVADRARRLIRSRMPWRNSSLMRRIQQRQDAVIARQRRLADRARNTVERLIGWVAGERMFLNTHVHGFEIRTTTAADISVSVGLTDSSGAQWGFANLGASAAAGAERQFVMHGELVPEMEAISYEQKVIFTTSIAAAAGFGIGGAVSAERVLELSQKTQVGLDGVQESQSGTTVKLTLDGALMGALGAVVSGQAGVGGEIVVEMRLEDLIGYRTEALAILMGNDTDKAADLLRALPIVFCARGRYEAGFAAGIGVEMEGVFEGGIGASAMMTDWGTGFEYEGGSNGDQFATMMGDGPLQARDASVTAKLEAVMDEVARATR